MRVLVSGATGFVGRHLVAELLARGHRVVALGRSEANARRLPWFEAVEFVAHDLHAPSTGPFEGLDAAVHLAWPGLPDYRSLRHLEETLPASYRFLKGLATAGCGQLLVAGTCFEYGLQSGPLGEELPALPVTPYAIAKDSLHRHLAALQTAFRDEHPFRLQWARLFYLHGEGQNPNSLMGQLERAIDEGAEAFPMSGGEQLRDYLPVAEVARLLAEVLERRDFDGVINICSGEPISVRRLVERRIAERGARLTPRLGVYPYPDYEPLAFWGDDRKLRTLLGAITREEP